MYKFNDVESSDFNEVIRSAIAYLAQTSVTPIVYYNGELYGVLTVDESGTVFFLFLEKDGGEE